MGHVIILKYLRVGEPLTGQFLWKNDKKTQKIENLDEIASKNERERVKFVATLSYDFFL